MKGSEAYVTCFDTLYPTPQSLPQPSIQKKEAGDNKRVAEHEPTSILLYMNI